MLLLPRTANPFVTPAADPMERLFASVGLRYLSPQSAFAWLPAHYGSYARMRGRMVPATYGSDSGGKRIFNPRTQLLQKYFQNNMPPTGTQEPPSSNLALQSEFAASWTGIRASVSAVSDTGPYGTVSARRLIEDNTASNSHSIQQNVTLTAVPHTVSVHVKAGTRTWVLLRNSTAAVGRYFNLATGALGGVIGGTPTHSVARYRGNGWWRISITFNGTAASHNFALYPATGDGGITYSGDGASYIQIFGFQIDPLLYMTAYKPTTTAAVPSGADALRWVHPGFAACSAEGSLVAVIEPPWGYDTTVSNTQATVCALNTGDANANPLLRLYHESSTDKWAANYVSGSGSVFPQISSTHSAGDLITLIATWKAGSQKLYVNGVLGTATTDAGVLSGFDRLEIGGRISGDTRSGCNVFGLTVFPRELNASECGVLGGTAYRNLVKFT